MPPRKLRTYENIWTQLKQKATVRIGAPIFMHRRIIKAVLKEKYMDVGYKYLLQEEFKKAKIEYKCEQSMITFKLIVSKDNYAL